MKSWVCAECQAKNVDGVDVRFCAKCGTPRVAALNPKPAPEPEFIAPWNRPDFKPSVETDLCPEPGCGKTVRQHIDECLEITSRPGTVFSRPSQREAPPTPTDEVLELRRQLLAQQAELLRRQAEEADEIPF